AWHAGRAGARRLLRALRVPRGERDGYGELHLFSGRRAGRGSRRGAERDGFGNDGRSLPRAHAAGVAGRVRSAAPRRAGVRRGALAGHSTDGLERTPRPRVGAFALAALGSAPTVAA